MNQNINIDLENINSIECENCKGETFTPVFIIKHLSALISPSGEETLIPIQIFKCCNCDHINEIFSGGLTN